MRSGNFPKLHISAERELSISLGEGQPFAYVGLKPVPSKAYLDIKGLDLSDVMSRKMRETMLVGGKLSSVVLTTKVVRGTTL